ncbi:MAG: NmrA/HSCARG family protein [Gemmatimonadota bacterium]|nr:NmrA/HSCARG family protein [Gemmatimonadota bacterium]MDH3424508.1 NmrA/HSCARG family protein [Gemmatimonadota bacterium]
MSDRKMVLVTGATGQQGGATARALLERGVRVRGVTRKADSEASRALVALGAEMVSADYADPVSLGAAMEGADSVFAVATPFEAGVEAETAQGIALVEAAEAAGLSHFVYSSVANAGARTGVPHFESKYRVEQHLAASALKWTVIAPVYFMDNLFYPDALDGVRKGAYAIALPPDVALQQIAVEDIGTFAAHVLTHADAFAGQRIDIAGDELSSRESAQILSDTLGRPISTFEIPIDTIRSFSEDLALMYEWFARKGYSVDIDGLRSSYPAVSWTRFAEFAERLPGVLDDGPPA